MGSESTSMAKAVLKWKASGAVAEKLWNELGQINSAIYEKLRVLPSMELNFPAAFQDVISYASDTSPAEWSVEDIVRHRSSMRSNASIGIPVELSIDDRVLY